MSARTACVGRPLHTPPAQSSNSSWASATAGGSFIKGSNPQGRKQQRQRQRHVLDCVTAKAASCWKPSGPTAQRRVHVVPAQARCLTQWALHVGRGLRRSSAHSRALWPAAMPGGPGQVKPAGCHQSPAPPAGRLVLAVCVACVHTVTVIATGGGAQCCQSLLNLEDWAPPGGALCCLQTARGACDRGCGS